MANLSIVSLWEVKTANGSYSVEIEGIDKKAALKEFKKQFPQAGKPSSIEMITQQSEKPEAPNGNGKTATATTPQKPEVIAIKPEVKQDEKPATVQEKPEETPVKARMEHDFIDYLPSKIISTTMLVIEGKRIAHSEAVTACAVGVVHMQIAGKKFALGEIKEQSMVLDESVFQLPGKTDDAITYEDILAVKLETEKQWCRGVKEALASQKKASQDAKGKARKAKMEAMLKLIK